MKHLKWGIIGLIASITSILWVMIKIVPISTNDLKAGFFMGIVGIIISILVLTLKKHNLCGILMLLFGVISLVFVNMLIPGILFFFCGTMIIKENWK